MNSVIFGNFDCLTGFRERTHDTTHPSEHLIRHIVHSGRGAEETERSLHSGR